MKPDGFVHLHVHSEYSLLDGCCRLDKLLSTAAGMGMEALAITDHGNLYGAVEFVRKAEKYGVKPIIGCEVYVAPGSRLERNPAEAKPYHLVLLAKDEAGYRNLVSLVSKAHTEGFYYKPRVDKELLAQKSQGLIALSSCLAGEIARFLLSNDYAGAKSAALKYREIFGPGDFYLELQDQGLIQQQQVNAGLVQLSHELNIPLVATNDVHYLTQADAEVQDCLLCIGTGAKVSDRDRLRFPNDQFYLKSPSQMREIFAAIPEAITNTVEIADRCQFELKLGGMYLPVYPLSKGISATDRLRELCLEGISSHYGDSPLVQVNQRLKRELEIISALGYSDYFLIVWDFIRYAKSQGIPVGPGRGSAAGSIVAYLLDITGIDPLKYDLLFERFLNPERVTMPDIDIDFDYERRGEVIEYVRSKYGSDRVAQIITFGTLQARAAIRDLGRVLDWPISKVDQVAKLVPNELGISVQEAIAKEPRLAQLYQSDKDARKLLDLAKAVEGLPRHASTHAAGVVIGAGPLDEIVPLAQGTDQGAVTQFDMGSLEAVGLLKMDFLGLRTLTVVADSLRLVEETTGEHLDLQALEPDDPKVYAMLSAGLSQGVFQMESRLFHRLLLQVKPSCFEDLIALISLGRPGPMNMVPDFAARKNGQAPVEYLHPALEPILKETYGIMVYQEQVMRIASELAGFSLGEADLLRRAMGKKKLDVLLSMKERFLQGAADNGVEPATAQKIFEAMEYFANYGFNKSHAAAYALVAYWTAYLRCYYPTQFMAAIMTSVRGNTDKLRAYVFTANQLGLEVKGPDVNRSELHFSVEGKAIRFGLAAIKNMGEASAMAIIAQRREQGSYLGLEDLCQRLPGRVLNKSALESLIKSGACDGFGFRLDLLAQAEEVLERAGRQQAREALGQVSLFGDDPVQDETDKRSTEPREVNQERLLALEKEALGLYLSGHPMSRWRELVGQFSDFDLSDPEAWNDGQEVVIAGTVSDLRRRTTRKGQQMARLRIEDEAGSLDALAFPSLYSKRGGSLEEGVALLFLGRIDQQEEGAQLIINEVIPLDERHLKVLAEREFAAILQNGGQESIPRPSLVKIISPDKNIVLALP